MRIRYLSLIPAVGLFILAALSVAGLGGDQRVVNWPTWDQVIDTPDRFRVLSDYGDAAVLDRETGLVWQKSPATNALGWAQAHAHCNSRDTGNRFGWRLPTIQELASLLSGTTEDSIHLPPDNPFTNVRSDLLYWSANTRVINQSEAWVVNFQEGDLDVIGKDNHDYAWCVRGGQGVDLQ